jgi:hypothetical protein
VMRFCPEIRQKATPAARKATDLMILSERVRRDLRLPFNQRVAGSNPAALTTLENKRNLADELGLSRLLFPAERATKPLPAQK